MKYISTISTGLLLFFLLAGVQKVKAQDHDHDHDHSLPETTDTIKATEHYTGAQEPDTTKRINFWRITKRTGEMIPGNPDTLLTDFVRRTHVEGYGISMAYPGNLGLPMESRVYFDRPDRSRFMFADPYYNYALTPEKLNFINTKIPYSNLTYQSAGSRQNKEERLLGALSINFGKHINVGFNVDYLYARGFYMSQSAKRLDWNFYGSYITDRHRLHLVVNPTDYTNGENGGLNDDNYIVNPELTNAPDGQTKDFEVNYQRASSSQQTWNRQKGAEYYLNYRYNLGFERDTEKKDEDGGVIKEFIPVSSLIYTFNYIDKERWFNAKDTAIINAYYNNQDYWKTERAPNYSTKYREINNIFGLSLREGFSEWAKFDLTAFLDYETRQFTMQQDSVKWNTENQNSLYIGGELSKRTGKTLRYEAQGRLGVTGDNAGDFDVSGKIETRIPFLKKTASVIGRASFKSLSPTYYENNFHSKYIWWDNKKFDNVKKVRLGGSIDFPQSKTNISVDAENITDYIYFDKTGVAMQHSKTESGNSGNIRVLTATLIQNMKLGILHWDNQIAYQHSGNEDVLPLPDFSIYSNLYLQFVAAKVLTIQIGANANYFSRYSSPTYEPVTQQFRLQDEVKVGDYPIVNAYINCHLKYTRFFIEFYNLSSSFIYPPEYFSMAHYPLNPQIFKFGFSWDFHN